MALVVPLAISGIVLIIASRRCPAANFHHPSAGCRLRLD